MDSNADQGPQFLQIFQRHSKQQRRNKCYTKFSGMGLQDLLVVEICAGSARQTKTVRAKGMRGLESWSKQGCETPVNDYASVGNP